MCSLAPPAALAFDITSFPDRRRGVAEVAPAARGVMARQPARRGGPVVSTPQKRSRDDFDGNTKDREGLAAGEVSDIPALGQQRLHEWIRAELDAVCAFHRKAVLLCRGAVRNGAAKDASRMSAAGPRREAPKEEEAKRRKTASPPKSATTVAAHQKEPVKQQPPVQRVAPPGAKKVHKTRRRTDDIALAREECRRQVLEVDRTALPDETVYAHDLEELGIAPFEYAVTRTRSQARHRVPAEAVASAYCLHVVRCELARDLSEVR